MLEQLDREVSNLDVFDFLELPEVSQEDKKWNSKKKEFNFVFPYDHSERQYELGTEIAELDEKDKEFITNEIKVINSYCKTKISIPFYTIIALFFAAIAILFVLFYISLLIITFFFWNPFIFLLILLVFIRYAFAFVVFMFSTVNDKYRSIGLKRLINNQKGPATISWSYGRDGSWIEVRVVNKK